MSQAPSYSRTKKSLRNSAVALSLQVVTLLVGFFSRKIFLDYLGTEILGLNTTATSILNGLNLLELGTRHRCRHLRHPLPAPVRIGPDHRP